ncbi:hypothetical protein LINPERHAP2_LOCUS16812 [Linum perenne]
MDSAPAITRRSFSWVRMVTDVADRRRKNLTLAPAKRTISVAWEPGPAEWITLNSDGSFGARAGRATTGGLARDADGRCIFAYTMNLGNCSITRAEMRGAIEGLRRTWVVSTGRSSCNLTHRRRFISFLMKMILDISTLWKRPASKSYAVVTGR